MLENHDNAEIHFFAKPSKNGNKGSSKRTFHIPTRITKGNDLNGDWEVWATKRI